MDSRGREGFTLVETLIVMVVAGVLATIALPRLNVTRERAFRSALFSDLRSLANLQGAHHNVAYTFSDDPAALGYDATEGVELTINEATDGGWAATATHEGVDEGQCGIYYGDAAPSGGEPATTPGVVACSF